jgi:phospholipid-translocating ATPase
MINAGDIIVDSLEDIQTLITGLGVLTFYRQENLLFHLFYSCLIFGVPLFLFNWYCRFTGTSLQDSLIIFLYNFIFNFFNFFALALYDLPFEPLLLKVLPGLYIAGQREKTTLMRNFMAKVFIEGAFTGLFIFYIGSYIVNWSADSQGKTFDFGSMQFIIFVCAFTVFNLKILFALLDRGKLIVILTTVFDYAALVIYLYANKRNKTRFLLLSAYDFEYIWNRLFSDAETIFAQIICIAVPLGVSFLFRTIIVPRYFPNLFEYWRARKDQLEDFDEATNQRILVEFNRRTGFNIGALVRKIFVDAEEIDINIQDLLNPQDTSIGKMHLNPYTLKFKDSRYDREYERATERHAMHYFKIIYSILLSIFIIYMILAVSLTKSDQSVDIKESVTTHDRLQNFYI